jgi:hypothetical protein
MAVEGVDGIAIGSRVGGLVYTAVVPAAPNQMWVAYHLVYLPAGAGAVDRGVDVMC